MVAEGGKSKSNELPRRLLARDLKAAQAAIQAGTDPALAQILSVALLDAGADDGAGLFHWRVEAKGAPGTIFAGACVFWFMDVYVMHDQSTRGSPCLVRGPPTVRT